MSINVGIKNAVKKYGDFVAIKNITLDIKKGEFFTLLGPSGCGKTTLLRMIAGFNTIEGGEILFGDKVINNLPAHKRDIGMVFQNYAIFPHMTVYDNVAYGLRARKVEKEKADEMIMEALRTVQIAELKDRMPSNLSGGQQQRVALARAIVIKPRILLMDEPLSNLDAKLRVEMRTVIKKLQRDLDITTIYVTHDQEEALAISDRIAVMDRGVVRQLGTPEGIYMRPSNKFVSNFIGTSNFIDGISKGNKVEMLDYEMTIDHEVKDGPVTVSIRPEQFLFSDTEGLDGEITLATYLGDHIMYEVLLENNQTIEVKEYVQNVRVTREYGPVKIKPIQESVNIYSTDTELSENA